MMSYVSGAQVGSGGIPLEPGKTYNFQPPIYFIKKLSRAASRLSRERSASSRRRENRKPAADLESGKNVPEYLLRDF